MTGVYIARSIDGIVVYIEGIINDIDGKPSIKVAQEWLLKMHKIAISSYSNIKFSENKLEYNIDSIFKFEIITDLNSLRGRKLTDNMEITLNQLIEIEAAENKEKQQMKEFTVKIGDYESTPAEIRQTGNYCVAGADCKNGCPLQHKDCTFNSVLASLADISEQLEQSQQARSADMSQLALQEQQIKELTENLDEAKLHLSNQLPGITHEAAIICDDRDITIDKYLDKINKLELEVIGYRSEKTKFIKDLEEADTRAFNQKKKIADLTERNEGLDRQLSDSDKALTEADEETAGHTKELNEANDYIKDLQSHIRLMEKELKKIPDLQKDVSATLRTIALQAARGGNNE